MLSQEALCRFFGVFAMSCFGIEPLPPGPLVNTQTIMLIYIYIYIYIYICIYIYISVYVRVCVRVDMILCVNVFLLVSVWPFLFYLLVYFIDWVMNASNEIWMIHSHLQTLRHKSKFLMFAVAQCHFKIDSPDCSRNHIDIFTGKFNWFESAKDSSQ